MNAAALETIQEALDKGANNNSLPTRDLDRSPQEGAAPVREPEQKQTAQPPQDEASNREAAIVSAIARINATSVPIVQGWNNVLGLQCEWGVLQTVTSDKVRQIGSAFVRARFAGMPVASAEREVMAIFDGVTESIRAAETGIKAEGAQK